MDILASLSSVELAAIAGAGWLFALACFIGYHRPRKSTRARSYIALSRPASVIDIADLRARHDRIYRDGRAA